MDETRHERHIKDISKINKHKLNPISILNYSRAKDERIIEYFRLDRKYWIDNLDGLCERPIVPIFSFPFLLATLVYLSPVTTDFSGFSWCIDSDSNEKERDERRQPNRERERERKGIKKNRNTGKAEKWRQRKEGGKIYREPVYFHRFNARWK